MIRSGWDDGDGNHIRKQCLSPIPTEHLFILILKHRSPPCALGGIKLYYFLTRGQKGESSYALALYPSFSYVPSLGFPLSILPGIMCVLQSQMTQLVHILNWNLYTAFFFQDPDLRLCLFEQFDSHWAAIPIGEEDLV